MYSQKSGSFFLIRWPFRPVLCAAIAILIVVGTTQLMAESTSTLSDPYAGRQLFKDKGCITCHKIGNEGGDEGPNLADKKYCGTFLGLAATLWNHAPKMVAKSRKMGTPIFELSEQEISGIISYLCFMRYWDDRGTVFKGKKLLDTKKCSKCHSAKEGEHIAPDFTEIKFYVSPLYLAQEMWNHGPKMLKAAEDQSIKYKSLTNRDIVNIAAALRDIAGKTQIKKEYSAIGNVQNGQRLFKSKGCINCHSENAGDNEMPTLDQISHADDVLQIAEAMWNHGPQMWKKMEEMEITRPTFSGTEMADLVAYLFLTRYNQANGDAERGSRTFEEKACSNCHTAKKSHIDNDLIQLTLMETPLQMVNAMWNHAPNMVDRLKEEKIKWPELNEQEMTDLYAFLNAAE